MKNILQDILNEASLEKQYDVKAITDALGELHEVSRNLEQLAMAAVEIQKSYSKDLLTIHNDLVNAIVVLTNAKNKKGNMGLGDYKKYYENLENFIKKIKRKVNDNRLMQCVDNITNGYQKLKDVENSTLKATSL